MVESLCIVDLNLTPLSAVLCFDHLQVSFPCLLPYLLNRIIFASRLSWGLNEILHIHTHAQYSASHILGIWYMGVVVVCCCFYHLCSYSLLLFFKDGKIITIVRSGHWFSNLSLHQNYLADLLKTQVAEPYLHCFWFNNVYGWGLRICICNNFLSDANDFADLCLELLSQLIVQERRMCLWRGKRVLVITEVFSIRFEAFCSISL